MGYPKIIISAISGGSGKTIISLGIIRSLIKRGYSIAPFKKGPDYIDAAWMALAANQPCYNLDTFLIPSDILLYSFFNYSKFSDISIIEGNRGIYDSIDVNGSTSTADLAKLLKSSVILVLDCTKITRTMAAVVSGLINFDKNLEISGVILNRIAGARHESILRNSIEEHTSIKVLGAMPKLKNVFPERHMGLVPNFEHLWAHESLEMISEKTEKYVNIDAIIEKCKNNSFNDNSYNISNSCHNSIISYKSINTSNKPIIAIAKDSAFQFYYQENIDALEAAGAKIIYISPLSDKDIPDVDAIYLGGGFPETHAKQLDLNHSFKESIKKMIMNGLPVYAECGGLIYLGKEIILEDENFSMADILPLRFHISKRPKGHGYTILNVEKDNPFFEKGQVIKGHEFHYSSIIDSKENIVNSKKNNTIDIYFAFDVERGVGIKKQKDGIIYKNVLATYTHIHALGCLSWAPAVIKQAIFYKNNKEC